MIVCSECNSEDVETVMWVNHNTGESNGYWIDETIIEEVKYNYCNNCNKNVKLINKEI